MSDDQKDVGNIDSDASGDKGNTVSYESYQKLLKQRKADQEQRKADQEKLDEALKALEIFKQKEVEFEEKKLEEEGNWKEYLEVKQKQLVEKEQTIENLQNKLVETEKVLIDSSKLQAVLQQLPAPVKKPEYYSFIETDKIILNPETGDFEKDSLLDVANSFVKEHHSLLDFTNKKLPSDAAKGGNAGLTYDQWLKLPVAEKRKRQKDVKD